MKYIFKKESIEIPEGFRSLTDEEIALTITNISISMNIRILSLRICLFLNKN